MTRLTDILDIQISRSTTAVQRASFGIPCFIASHTRFAERARVYGNVDAVAVDFPTTSVVYKAAQQLFGADIAPSSIVVGRRQIDSVNGSVATVANSTVYTVTINGTALNYTSDSTATAIEIATGLAAAFTATPAAGTSFTDHLDGTFTVANTVAGTALVVTASANLNIVNVAASETWADTIGAVRNANDTWYALTTETHVDADIEAIAAYIETQKKIYVASTSESSATGSGSTDVGSVLKALNYVRTFLMYSGNADTQYPECAWISKCITEAPGSTDWTYKQLVGVTPDVLNDTVTANLHGKNYTTYETLGGVNATVGGNMVGGEKIDIIIGVDWMEATMRENIWFRMVNTKKISYTAAGATVIETEIRRVMADGIANNFLSATPAPIVNMPNTLTQNPVDRANRVYSGITFEATLAGAIRFVKIRGTVTI